MKKFRVHVYREVRECSTIVVDAETRIEAIDKVRAIAQTHTWDWITHSGAVRVYGDACEELKS